MTKLGRVRYYGRLHRPSAAAGQSCPGALGAFSPISVIRNSSARFFLGFTLGNIRDMTAAVEDALRNLTAASGLKVVS